MGIDIVTDKYSTAIFELAKEQSMLESMEADLLYVKSVLDNHDELKALLINPLLEVQAKCDVLGKIFSEQIHTLALHFLYVMVKRGRSRFIGETIGKYLTKSRAERGILEATVTVVEPLTEGLQQALIGKLKSITGKDFVIHEIIDTSIIGGMVIQIGDTRIDASMMRRLEELKKALLKAGTTEIGVKG